MSLQMALFHSFLWLRNSPLYTYTNSSCLTFIRGLLALSDPGLLSLTRKYLIVRQEGLVSNV